MTDRLRAELARTERDRDEYKQDWAKAKLLAASLKDELGEAKAALENSRAAHAVSCAKLVEVEESRARLAEVASETRGKLERAVDGLLYIIANSNERDTLNEAQAAIAECERKGPT